MFEDGTQTVLVKQKIEMYITPDDIFDAVYEYIKTAKKLESTNIFKENLKKYLKKKNPGIDYNLMDDSSLRKELSKRYKSAGIVEPKSVRDNWLNGVRPELSQDNRKNMYNFCIAMGMNVEETKEFFLKTFWTIPFNYKDVNDAIYYYGISNKKEYKDIEKLREDIEKIVDKKVSYEGNDNKETQRIRMDISDIHDDAVFKEYIINNHINSKKSFRTAQKIILDSLKKDKELAKKEFELYQKEIKLLYKDKAASKKFINEDSEEVIDELLNWIFVGWSGKGISLNEIEGLPEGFKRGFPRAMELSNIKNDKASPDVCRKALIVLKFYEFFGNILFKDHIIQRDEEEIKEDFCDFHTELCENLDESGFVQLYYRNPFDWVILFCARQENPIDVFRQCLSGE